MTNWVWDETTNLGYFRIHQYSDSLGEQIIEMEKNSERDGYLTSKKRGWKIRGTWV